MAVPKRRTSKAVKNQRKSHWKISPVGLTLCPQCKEAILPHRVCKACGHYRNRNVMGQTEDA